MVSTEVLEFITKLNDGKLFVFNYDDGYAVVELTRYTSVFENEWYSAGENDRIICILIGTEISEEKMDLIYDRIVKNRHVTVDQIIRNYTEYFVHQPIITNVDYVLQ